jgi:hypothetical protein
MHSDGKALGLLYSSTSDFFGSVAHIEWPGSMRRQLAKIFKDRNVAKTQHPSIN